MGVVEGFLGVYWALEPVVDILVTTGILYAAYQIIVKTNAMQIVRAGFLILIVYVLAYVLRLNVLVWILGKVAPALAVGLAIVFQPEIRKLILKLGQFDWRPFAQRSKHTYADAVVIAAETLSKKKKGMLVVFQRGTKLDNYIESGTMLNADISSALLVTIFSFETPLHDAACIVDNGKIIAAGCFLPLSERFDIKKTFGTRHRAAIGMSEQTDAVVLIVSEETGAMSIACDSTFYYDLTTEQLSATLNKLLDMSEKNKTIENTIDESISVN